MRNRQSFLALSAEDRATELEAARERAKVTARQVASLQLATVAEGIRKLFPTATRARFHIEDTYRSLDVVYAGDEVIWERGDAEVSTDTRVVQEFERSKTERDDMAWEVNDAQMQTHDILPRVTEMYQGREYDTPYYDLDVERWLTGAEPALKVTVMVWDNHRETMLRAFVGATAAEKARHGIVMENWERVEFDEGVPADPDADPEAAYEFYRDATGDNFIIEATEV